MSFARPLSAVLGLIAIATATHAGTPGAPPQRRDIAPVRHGIELTATLVGPAALGPVPTARFPGGAIHDGKAYPFAREVAASATYDGFDVIGPHLLIERAAFTGPLDIYVTRPVVMRGVRVRTTTAAPWALHTRPGSGPLHFLWSEAGAASVEGAPHDASRAQQRALYLRGDGAVVYRSHLSLTSDGIQIHGLGARVIETLIDGLTFWTGDHNDGIQMLGRGADAHIVRSRIVNANPQTSCLTLIGDRVRVENNYLSGGGWTIYGGASSAGPTREVIVTGNRFGREHFPKGGHFGVAAYWDITPGTGNVWTDNRFVDGAIVAVGGQR